MHDNPSPSPESSGVWLVLEGPAGPSSTPLSLGECLGVASAVAAWAAGGGETLLDLLENSRPAEAAAGQSPVVAAWVAAGRGRGESCQGLFARLRDDLLFAAEHHGVSQEARLLSQVVALAAGHRELVSSFDARLRESRIDAMRRLAYGAGHEINNPLANIAARGQSLLRDEVDPERRRRLATIVDQAFRARDMIGGLMVFARPPKPCVARIDLTRRLAEVVTSLGRSLAGRAIRLEYQPPPEPVVADLDPAIVADAVRAVLLNALEAVGERGRVELAVARQGGDGQIVVSVIDDGPGLSREEIDRVFDPFHSGREAGRGLGIGLSKAWRLVQLCDGNLSINAREGLGTTVRIELPEAGGSACDRQADSGRDTGDGADDQTGDSPPGRSRGAAAEV